MKKQLFFLACFLFSFLVSRANPIDVPQIPSISEIYFDENNNWYIEFQTYYMQLDINSFDEISLETSSGTADFKSGISFTDTTVIITIDSMTNPLYINPNGDFIRLYFHDEDHVVYHPSEYIFIFGNYEMSYVTSLHELQSYCLFTNSMNVSRLAKCSTPTVGYSNDDLNCDENLLLKITDEVGNQITNVRCYLTQFAYNYETNLNYDWDFYDVDLFFKIQKSADDNGEINFSGSEICAMNSELIFKTTDNNYLYDTIISIAIEPGAENVFEITLDCDLIFVNTELNQTIDYGMKVYPNPVNEEATITFNSNGKINTDHAIIKIFSDQGDLIDIIPVINNNSQPDYNIKYGTSGLASGSYYCNLEISGKKVSTAKMIVIK